MSEETLNFISYWGNANLNTSEIPPHAWLKLKTLTISSVDKDVKQPELLHSDGGHVKCYKHSGK